MARATFVKSAQKNIYRNGKYVTYTSKRGKGKGNVVGKYDRTIPADKKDPIVIAKGESYYWWAFKRGGKHFSKTAPRRSQLTQSSFKGSLYDLEDRISTLNVETKEDFDTEKEDILSEIDSLKDQCQESLDNMPESLQDAPTGQLLQERIEALESWYSDIENIEVDEKEEDESDEDYKQRVIEAGEELQNTSCDL